MKQAAVETPTPESSGAPQTEQSRFAGLFQDIRAARREITAITACALAGLAGAALTSQAPNPDHALPAPTPKVKGPHYRPITELYRVPGGNEAVKTEARSARDSFGHTVSITQPDKETADVYSSYFHTPLIHVTRPPNLKETIHIQDENTFSEVYERHSRYYPFDIHNTTDRPVDLLFTSYAIRATQLWLNKTGGAEGPDIKIDNDTLADVEPIADPHVMILIDKIPVGAKSSPRSRTEGVTRIIPGGNTRSFIENTRSAQEPFRREAIATEICQSLVNVTDGRAVPGMEPQQRLILEKTGSLFNRPSTVYGLDLASQERVCNGLGSYVTAAYERNPDLPGTTFRKFIFRPTALVSGGLAIEAQWEDYDLYRPEKQQFVELAKRIIHRDYNEVIVDRGAASPTLDFYRRHQQF